MKKHYEVSLEDYYEKRLQELLGFLKGLKAAGKDVPGFYAVQDLITGLREVNAKEKKKNE